MRWGEKAVRLHATGHPEVGESLRGALAGHGRAAVKVQGKHLGLDALLEAGLFDQLPVRHDRVTRGRVAKLMQTQPAEPCIRAEASARTKDRPVRLRRRPAYYPVLPGRN